ncbi:hypothetical protein ASF01_13555 [Stenotrophomonas sp. Leaf70]|nr:hypothetical protein ASF01_13555 [Stenotrophomonas sp. Leaf70]
MQQREAPVVLVSIYENFVADLLHSGRHVLAYPIDAYFNGTQLKLQDRRHPLDALEHAGGQRGEQ